MSESKGHKTQAFYPRSKLQVALVGAPRTHPLSAGYSIEMKKRSGHYSCLGGNLTEDSLSMSHKNMTFFWSKLIHIPQNSMYIMNIWSTSKSVEKDFSNLKLSEMSQKAML